VQLSHKTLLLRGIGQFAKDIELNTAPWDGWDAPAAQGRLERLKVIVAPAQQSGVADHHRAPG
jgi:hypothetical protein